MDYVMEIVIDVASEQQLFIVIDVRYFSRGSREAFEWIAERKKKSEKTKVHLSRRKNCQNLYPMASRYLQYPNRGDRNRAMGKWEASADDWMNELNKKKTFVHTYIYMIEWEKVKGGGGRERKNFLPWRIEAPGKREFSSVFDNGSRSSGRWGTASF